MSAKILAVTGGAQGIGRAVAYAFADAGYDVSIFDPVGDAGEEAAAHVRQTGRRAVFHAGSTGSAADVAAWLDRTVAELGCPDVLVNNAGILRNAPFLELSVEDFDEVIAVNLRGAFLCTQNVARRMADRGRGGAVINIASTRAFMSEPGTEAYSASKGGIIALTHATAISLAQHRIRVNAVSPGWIETRDWQYSERAKKPVHSRIDREQHPVGRVGEPTDIAEACLFLAEHAGFMTGQNITIDGGMTVKMIYAE
jgi:NAD(P)-dependent dehydrogenase (short-subunit alcohol dehydrogenase family)